MEYMEAKMQDQYEASVQLESELCDEALQAWKEHRLTPRQLAEQRAELLVAARKAYNRWAYADDTYGEVTEAMNKLAELLK